MGLVYLIRRASKDSKTAFSYPAGGHFYEHYLALQWQALDWGVLSRLPGLDEPGRLVCPEGVL